MAIALPESSPVEPAQREVVMRGGDQPGVETVLLGGVEKSAKLNTPVTPVALAMLSTLSSAPAWAFVNV